MLSDVTSRRSLRGTAAEGRLVQVAHLKKIFRTREVLAVVIGTVCRVCGLLGLRRRFGCTGRKISKRRTEQDEKRKRNSRAANFSHSSRPKADAAFVGKRTDWHRQYRTKQWRLPGRGVFPQDATWRPPIAPTAVCGIHQK
jgi:hypothetical protein